MSIDQDTTEAFDVLARRVRRLETQVAYALSGGPCVTFVCGATGWRGTGGVIPRTLVHEVAFQLDTGGNARGAYAVDLQQDRNNATEIAGGDYSFIHGQDNRIDPGGDYSFAAGWSNELGAGAWMCYAMGGWNDIDIAATYPGGQYLVYLFGESHDIDEGNYVFFGGSNIDVIDEAFGAYSFGENNTFEAIATSDYPTYTGSFAAIGCLQKGDVWSSLQVGEDNTIDNTVSAADQWIFQFGFDHFARHIKGALQIGQETCAYDPDQSEYYDSSFLIGNGSNDGFATVPWQGMNQGRILSQAGWISTWNVAWTTEWEFPIRPDMVHYFETMVVGTESGAVNSYAWKVDGVVENDGGTTSILAGSVTVTNIYRDVATKEIQVVADDPNDRLLFQFRDTGGPDATACNLQIMFRMVEVGND